MALSAKRVCTPTKFAPEGLPVCRNILQKSELRRCSPPLVMVALIWVALRAKIMWRDKVLQTGSPYGAERCNAKSFDNFKKLSKLSAALIPA
jgi:hypothetical protein